MKKSIAIVVILATIIASLTACGNKEEDNIGIIVSVEDNDSHEVNNIIAEDSDTDNIDDDKSDETIQIEDTINEDIEYITGGFVTENGDVYQFNPDGTYSYFIVETNKSLNGTFETDGKSYITLKYTDVNSDTDDIDDTEYESDDTEYESDDSSDDNSIIAYTTKDMQEDGTIILTEYDELDNIINQYVIEEAISEETIVVNENNKNNVNTNNNTTYEITYKLNRKSAVDDYGNSIEILVMSKEKEKIILKKQFDL